MQNLFGISDIRRVAVDCNQIMRRPAQDDRAGDQADHVTSHKMGFPLCSVCVLRLERIQFASMGPPQGTRKWLFYTFLGMIADALDAILTYVIPDKTPQRSIVVSKFYPLTLLHPPVPT